MSRFAATLTGISERLDLPQPARSRILLEIAGDMEDLYAAYRREGLPEEEARRRAIAGCDLSDEALAALAAVHHGPVRRQLDRLSARDLRRWERGVLLVVVAAAFQASGWLTRSGRIFDDAGSFAWPLLGVAVVGLVMAGVKFYQLFLKQDHGRRAVRRRLDAPLGAAVALLWLGFAGCWWEVVRLLAGPRATDGAPVAVMFQWALRATALLQLSLGLALLCALAWFGLAGKVGRIERHEGELLLRQS